MCSTMRRTERHAGHKETGEHASFKLRNRVWELEVIEPDDTWEAMRKRCRGNVFFRSEGFAAVSVWKSLAEPGPDREDDGLHGPGEVDTDHDDHDPACEAGVIQPCRCKSGRHDKGREEPAAPGHAPYCSWCQAHVAGCDAVERIKHGYCHPAT